MTIRNSQSLLVVRWHGHHWSRCGSVWDTDIADYRHAYPICSSNTDCMRRCEGREGKGHVSHTISLTFHSVLTVQFHSTCHSLSLSHGSSHTLLHTVCCCIFALPTLLEKNKNLSLSVTVWEEGHLVSQITHRSYTLKYCTLWLVVQWNKMVILTTPEWKFRNLVFSCAKLKNESVKNEKASLNSYA